MKRFFIILISAGLFTALFSGCNTPTMEQSQQEQGQEDILSNADILKMHEEIIKLRKRIYDDTQIKMQAGQAQILDVADARAKLAEANINLANLQNRQDLVVMELQNLLQFYISAKNKLEQELDSGIGLARDLYELEIGLIETNIRLSEIALELKTDN